MWCADIEVSALFVVFFFFQAEDGIRDLVRSRGLGDVYKRQVLGCADGNDGGPGEPGEVAGEVDHQRAIAGTCCTCLLYTSDAADERSSVDLGGRRIIKKKNKMTQCGEEGHIDKQ